MDFIVVISSFLSFTTSLKIKYVCFLCSQHLSLWGIMAPIFQASITLTVGIPLCLLLALNGTLRMRDIIYAPSTSA
jgi:hypothetical protein